MGVDVGSIMRDRDSRQTKDIKSLLYDRSKGLLGIKVTSRAKAAVPSILSCNFNLLDPNSMCT